MKILEVKDLVKTYSNRKVYREVLKGIDLSVNYGEAVGIVGRSGCGKSTLAKVISRLERADEGKIIFMGKDITFLKYRELKEVYRHMQMVFQNPVESFNPRKKIGNSIIDTMVNFGFNKRNAKREMIKLLKKCGLEEETAEKYPHELSGGQCQRAAIARAISIKPSLIICDEVTSALDVTVQEQILEVLESLKNDGMSILFISHDIALVQQLCNRIIVINEGKIVEEGNSHEVINRPKHSYTKELIDAVIY